MSFALTKRQYCDGSKRITRRLGWANLKPGQHFLGVSKCMGLKKGEQAEIFHESVCLSNRPEPLNAIDQQDVIDEGFPEMTPAEFVSMFCGHMRCAPDQIVNRIVFAPVSPSQGDKTVAVPTSPAAHAAAKVGR